MIIKQIFRKNITNETFTNVQIRYFICFYATHAWIHLQSPYKYQRYLECGLSPVQISYIICIQTITTAVWNLAMPFLLKQFGHAKTLNFCTFLFAISSFCRYYGTFTSFSIASVLSGISIPTQMMTFTDFWMQEEFFLPPECNAQYVFSENKSLVTLISSLILSPLGAFVYKKWGTEALFGCMPGLLIVGMIPVNFLFHPSHQIENKGAKNDIIELKKYINSKKTVLLVVLLDALYALGFFLFMQRQSGFLFTNDHKPVMSYVEGSFSVADLNGAQIMAMISIGGRKSPIVYTMTFLFIAAISMITIYTNFDDKVVVYFALLTISLLRSSLMANLNVVRKLFYPNQFRSYFMSFAKLPTSIIECLVVWYWRDVPIQDNMLIAATAFIFCIYICIFLLLSMFQTKNEDEHGLLPMQEEEDFNENGFSSVSDASQVMEEV